MTSKGCFGWLAFLSFALALLFGIGAALFKKCGVTVFSPQVSWGDRLMFFLPAAIAAGAGILFMYWACKDRQR